MTATLADVPYTMSDRDLRYVESAVCAVRDAVLTRAHHEPCEIPLSFPGGTVVIRVLGAVPAWLEPTAAVLEELLWLDSNWDSYGALPVDVDQAFTVLELLGRVMNNDTPHPQLVPTNRGGVQVEWHRSGIDVEIETLMPGRLSVSYEDSNRDEESEWEQDLADDWTRLSRALARLS